MSLAKEIAEILLSIGAVEVRPQDPFTYASGLKGPIYCDNRKLLSYPTEREKICQGFVSKIQEKNIDFDQLAGLATAGIAHAAYISQSLKRPMVYVRSKPKGHGKGNQIEGDLGQGKRLLLVEDLVNQGASLNEALLGIQNAEASAVACLCIVTYETPAAQEVFKKWDLPLISLTNFQALLEVAKDQGRIDKEGLDSMQRWHKDPKNWTP